MTNLDDRDLEEMRQACRKFCRPGPPTFWQRVEDFIKWVMTWKN